MSVYPSVNPEAVDEADTVEAETIGKIAKVFGLELTKGERQAMAQAYRSGWRHCREAEASRRETWKSAGAQSRRRLKGSSSAEP